MAIEVQEARYEVYIPPKDNPKPIRGQPPLCPVEPIFLHNYLHDVESLFWIGLHTLFSTVPAVPTAVPPAPCKPQCQFLNCIFPYCLDGGPARHDLLVTGNFLEAAVDLPPDYQRNLEQFVFLRLVLVFRYKQAYDELNFPQHKNFDSVNSTEDPDLNLISGFETVAEAAYSGNTQLLPDDDIDTPAPSWAMSLREENGDNDDQTLSRLY